MVLGGCRSFLLLVTTIKIALTIDQKAKCSFLFLKISFAGCIVYISGATSYKNNFLGSCHGAPGMRVSQV